MLSVERADIAGQIGHDVESGFYRCRCGPTCHIECGQVAEEEMGVGPIPSLNYQQ